MKNFVPIRLLAVGCLAIVAAACSSSDKMTSPDVRVSAARAAATTADPTVTSTTPSTSVRNVTLNVHVFGTGFDRGSKAQWALGGVPSGKVTTNSTTYVSSRELVANITIAADANISYYDVVVTASSGKPGIGTEMFEIIVETTNLGTLGGPESQATSINDQGQIVGGAYTQSSQMHPFLWTDGVLRDLGVLPGDGGYSLATGINNTGMVSGYASINGAFKPWMWTSAGGMKLLPLPAGMVTGYAEEVSDDGTIVGSVGEIATSHAATWKNGVITDVHPKAGGSSHAWSINGNGDVMGHWYAGSESNSDGIPFVRRATGEVIWLPCPGVRCSGGSLNSNGDVVGSVTYSNGTYAYRWTGYGIGPAAAIGGSGTAAIANSDAGFIAGTFHFTIWNNDGAALWGSGGAQVQLQSESHKTATRGAAADVNSSGWVVGYYYTSVKGTLYKRAVRWRYPIV